MNHIKIIVSSDNPTAEHDCVFTQIVSDIIYIYRGQLQYFYWKKGTYECIEMPCEYYCLKRNEVKYYWARVLKNDTTIYEMDELVEHCLVSFEISHKQYIIMPSLSFKPLLIEESPFVTVQSPPGFVNRENETGCYLNSTLQHLYYNVIFRKLAFKINFYTMLNGLKIESQHFVHNFQNIMILR